MANNKQPGDFFFEPGRKKGLLNSAEIIGYISLGTMLAGGIFAFINHYWLNPAYQYIEIRCRFNKYLINSADLPLKVEKKNGKLNQVFCPCNKQGACQGKDMWGRNENFMDAPKKCWVYEN